MLRQQKTQVRKSVLSAICELLRQVSLRDVRMTEFAAALRHVRLSDCSDFLAASARSEESEFTGWAPKQPSAAHSANDRYADLGCTATHFSLNMQGYAALAKLEIPRAVLPALLQPTNPVSAAARKSLQVASVTCHSATARSDIRTSRREDSQISLEVAYEAIVCIKRLSYRRLSRNAYFFQ